jgi:flagellar hook assembly protein FlgD
VRVLDAGPRQAGQHRLVWNGADATGRSLPSGVYFVRLVADTGVRTQKVSLIR